MINEKRGKVVTTIFMGVEIVSISTSKSFKQYRLRTHCMCRILDLTGAVTCRCIYWNGIMTKRKDCYQVVAGLLFFWDWLSEHSSTVVVLFLVSYFTPHDIYIPPMCFICQKRLYTNQAWTASIFESSLQLCVLCCLVPFKGTPVTTACFMFWLS